MKKILSMKTVPIIVIIIGFLIAGYNTHKWYKGTKMVYNLPSSSVVLSESSPIDESQPDHRTKTQSKEEIVTPEVTVMSDQLERHKKGDNMAELRVPVLKQAFSVFWGTDENTLKKGVGMYVSKWTTTPEQFGHTVLSGHRDTVFTKLGDVKKGDEITLDYEGKQYIYEVKDFWITDPNDRTVIVKKDKPTLTLTTCYPFNYIGNAPKRYIIQAELINIARL
jgi:sortase A